MQAKGKRKLRDRSVYDHCFKKPLYKDLLIKTDIDTNDTVDYIRKVIRSKQYQTREIAKRLKADTLKNTCRNIWEFCYYYIDYQIDSPGKEEIETPNRIWANAETDCDGYATMIGTILANLGIPYKIRVTAYKGSWQHVYIVVPVDGKLSKKLDQDANRGDYIVIDPVTDFFDYEVRYSKNFDTPMELLSLEGLGDPSEVPYVNIVRVLRDPNTGLIFGFDEQGNVYEQEESIAGLEGLWKAITGKKFRDTKVGGAITEATDKVGQALKDAAKWTGDKVGKGFKFFNRYLNPATILLRNGWLLAMKIDLFNVAERLRWGYVPYSEAKAKMNMSEAGHKQLVNMVKDMEKIYDGFGGVVANLKKGILNGKGNRDGKIGNDTADVMAANDQSELDLVLANPDSLPDGSTLSGLGLIEGYNPLIDAYNQVLGGLGEPVTGTAALAAVSAAVLALSDKIAPIIKSIKGTASNVSAVKNDIQSLLPVQSKGIVVQPSTIPQMAIPATLQPAVQPSASVSTTNNNPPKEEKKFYETPAFWAVAGLGAAGIGTAVYLGTKKEGGVSGFGEELSGIPKKRSSLGRKRVQAAKKREAAKKRANAPKPASKPASKSKEKFSLAGIKVRKF